MNNLRVLQLEQTSIGESQADARTFLVHICRLAFFLGLLAIYGILNISYGQYINSDFSMSVYTSSIIVFLNTALLFINWDYLKSNNNFLLYLVIMDIFSVFILIQTSYFSPSQFVFIYLGAIIFSGLLLRFEQALFIASLACLFFSFNMVSINPLASNLSYLLNNFSFLLTAYLSASLSGHLSEVSFKLKEKEKEIIAIKNINQLIVDNMSSGVITVDNNGAVLTFNKSSQLLFKTIKVGDDITKHIDSSDAQLNDKGRYETSQEYNGDKRIVESIHSVLKDESQMVKGQIILVRDLTKIKKLEYAARQQDKLAAVGQLAAGIAHEIRNPLASISGSVQLLESTSADPENNKLFKIILKEIDRLNGLITEFLEFVKPDKVNQEPISLDQLVIEVMNMVKFNKQVRQDVSVDEELKSSRFIHADYSKLKQALLNIVLNSYQAMESSEKPMISLHSFDEEDKVVLHIADTGSGIKPETLSKIFEPFLTTKSKGTGLGLAITHKILQNHDAKVFVESEVGVGTKFIIEFPGRGELRPDEASIEITA